MGQEHFYAFVRNQHRRNFIIFSCHLGNCFSSGMTDARASIKDVNFIHLCICLMSSERKRGFKMCPGNLFLHEAFRNQKQSQGIYARTKRELREKKHSILQAQSTHGIFQARRRHGPPYTAHRAIYLGLRSTFKPLSSSALAETCRCLLSMPSLQARKKRWP